MHIPQQSKKMKKPVFSSFFVKIILVASDYVNLILCVIVWFAQKTPISKTWQPCVLTIILSNDDNKLSVRVAHTFHLEGQKGYSGGTTSGRANFATMNSWVHEGAEAAPGETVLILKGAGVETY